MLSTSPEGSNFHLRLAGKPPNNLNLATYPELAADEDTTRGGVGLETELASVLEEDEAFEEDTGGVPGAERLYES